MLDRLPVPARRALATFGSFTAGQKAVTLVSVLALAIGGFFFANWASAPSYAPLFSNLSGTDASAIVEKLTTEGAPYQLADGGSTILVPQEQVYDLRIKMSGEGLPAEADSGYALLDKQGITTSEFMQHVGYQRALEGELANTIKAIDGVKAATVHLAIPQKDIFADDAQKPTASVLVASKVGKDLSGGQVQAIVNLVASSVEGLEPDQVTVAGADGSVLSTGGGQSLASGSDVQTQQTVQFEQRMGGALQRMLDSVVGPGHAVVTTTVDLDFDSTETKTQTYQADPALPPLSENITKESYTGGAGATNGGVLGPDNIQVPNNAGNGEYETSTEARTNAVGMVTETRKSAPGKVRKLSVAVLMDSNVAAKLDTAQVEQMVSSAVGLDTERGDTMAVTALPFDQSANEKAEQALAAAAAEEKQAGIMSMAKTGAMVFAVLVLVFLAWRASRRAAKRSQLSPAELEELARLQAEIQRTQTAALEASEAAPALEAAPVNAVLEQRDARQREIASLVERQPDEVAQLLRGWLADRRS